MNKPTTKTPKFNLGEKSLYELELNQILRIETDDQELYTSAMRVPGGWIYRSYDKGSRMMACVFVPFNKKYQAVAK